MSLGIGVMRLPCWSVHSSTTEEVTMVTNHSPPPDTSHTEGSVEYLPSHYLPVRGRRVGAQVRKNQHNSQARSAERWIRYNPQTTTSWDQKSLI